MHASALSGEYYILADLLRWLNVPLCANSAQAPYIRPWPGNGAAFGVSFQVSFEVKSGTGSFAFYSGLRDKLHAGRNCLRQSQMCSVTEGLPAS
jgi:hypothetical protein